MAVSMETTSIILAGGKNLRLGRDKAQEVFGSRSLLDTVIQRVRPISQQILVVTSIEKPELLVDEGIEILFDIYPDKGPLGGIYTGLMASTTKNNIVVACDMPFLNTGLLGFLVAKLGDYDAVVPRLGEEMLEPLHAVYSRVCLDVIKERLENNRLGVHSFVKVIRVRYIEREECLQFDPQLLSFFNINDQSDLERAMSLFNTKESKQQSYP